MDLKPCYIYVLSLLTWVGVTVSPGYAQSPVLHLKMDKESKPGISDQSGYTNDARMIGGVSFIPDRFGNECRAVRFDGTGYITVPHDKSLNLSANFTVSAWAQIPYGLKLQGLQWLTLVCKGEHPEETPVSPAFRAQLTSATTSVNTVSTRTIGNIRQSFPTDRWFHVAVVYNGKEVTIYLDGQEMRRYPLHDPIYTNREPLNIGRDIPGNTEYYQGDMDDLRLFPKALSAYEVKKLYKDESDKGLGSACPLPPPVASANPNPPTPTPQPSRGQPDLPPWQQMRPRPSDPPPTPNTPNPPVNHPPATDHNPVQASPPVVAQTGPRPLSTPPVSVEVDPRPEPEPVPAPVDEDPLPVDPQPQEPLEEVPVEDVFGPDTFPNDPAEPEEMDPFPVEEETSPTPNEETPPYDFSAYVPNNLTLVLDVSGSMNQEDKLPLLKNAFLQMLPYMRTEDKISVITYAGGVDLVLEGIPATDFNKIEKAIEKLASSGSTKGRRAVNVAHRVARKHFIRGGNNRVILATDGSFDLTDLYPIAEEMVDDGITLSVFSFGEPDRFRESHLDEVALRGKGNHAKIKAENVNEALLQETQVRR